MSGSSHMMMSERAAVLTREAWEMGMTIESTSDMLYRNGHFVHSEVIIELFVAMDEQAESMY